MPDDLQNRPADRRATELRLKRELDQARECYDCANREFEKASAHAHGLDVSTVDGAHELQQASKQLTATTIAYSKAVERFCDFILHGKLPEN